MHVCACEATLGLFGFVLRLRVPVSLFRQNGMAVAVSLVFGVTKKGSSPSAQVEEANERISSAVTSILLNANNFLPRSLREAPRW